MGRDVSGVDRLGSGARSYGICASFPLVLLAFLPCPAKKQEMAIVKRGCEGKSKIPKRFSLSV